MAGTEPAWTIGIEEEYLLVDASTGNLVVDRPPGLMEEASGRLGTQVNPEFLQSQIEVGTKVCTTVHEARADLSRLRREVADAASKYGLVPIACSTHPIARWADQKVTDADRYVALANDMQAVMRRLMISGMHVHVGIEDPDLRIDLMNQISYFLPHLLALSTSSPFWGGHNTGLKSYRKAVFKAAPRTGLPESFDSWGEYERHVRVLCEVGVIEDASKIWWDIRPSVRYPTLEMRVADLPTRVDDSLTIAALYVCWLRMLWRRRQKNQRWRSYANFLIEENIWRAQRYGVEGDLIDFGKGELVPFADLIEEIIELVRPDAEALDCVEFVENARVIASRGTSADLQLETYNKAIAAGHDEQTALRAVVSALAEETLANI
ncbi:MAG: carboxylate-amine ligase [Acidimicrobiia bacterium]|nr:carboxylate-amine ligase [Acidimicrobiia bacterium]